MFLFLRGRSILPFSTSTQQDFLCQLLLHRLVPAAGQELPDHSSKRSVQVEEEQRVEADVEHAQQQRRLFSQEQMLLDLTVCDDFGLSQRVRRPHRMIGNEADRVGQSYGRHAPHHRQVVRPEFMVAATAQKSLQSQAAGDEHGGGGVEEQRRAEEDGQSVPVEADVFLQRGAAEVPLDLKGPAETQLQMILLDCHV